MRIAEIFHSIQGEGEFAGTPTTFVRTTGCNLRCTFCDTPYTSWNPEGEQRDWQDILAEVVGYNCEHVDLTGGEPLLQPEVVPFTRALKEAGCYVTIETAGTVSRPVAADLMSISPKLSNSAPPSGVWKERHARLRHNPDVIRHLCTAYRHQLKFVIDQPADVDEVERWLEEFPEINRSTIWLMPQAITAEGLVEKATWLPALAQEHGFHTSPRLHVELYGNARGK